MSTARARSSARAWSRRRPWTAPPAIGATGGRDLVSAGPGEWLVLEDNLRMPGGLAMAVTVRDRIREGYPGFDARGEVHDPGAGLGALRDTLRAAAPDGVGDPSIAVVAGED